MPVEVIKKNVNIVIAVILVLATWYYYTHNTPTCSSEYVVSLVRELEVKRITKQKTSIEEAMKPFNDAMKPFEAYGWRKYESLESKIPNVEEIIAIEHISSSHNLRKCRGQVLYEDNSVRQIVYSVIKGDNGFSVSMRYDFGL